MNVYKFLRDIQGLKILPRIRVKGGSGIHLGSGRGVSMEFHGHSAYTPGEDIKNIDWKAYARTGGLYVRDFSEEKQVNIGVLLDRSASMDFGCPPKWPYAVNLALGLAYLTLHQGDPLSFLTAGDGLEVIKDHAAGMDHFYDLLATVQNLRPGEAMDQSAFPGGLEHVSGLLFVISDLFDVETELVLDHLALQGLRAVMIHILAPDELAPPCEGEFKLVDAESGRVKRIVINAARRRLYTAKMTAFMVKTRDTCMRRGAGYVLACTDAEPVQVLKQVLEVC